jgi:hypothetical protein
MRRITRQTDTQYIADCLHILELSDKYKEMYDNGHDHMYSRFDRCASVFYKNGDQFINEKTDLDNPDGVNKVTLIDDFNILKCKYTYKELFETDVRTFLPSDSSTLETINNKVEFYSSISKKFDYNEMYIIGVSESKHFTEISKHLEELFKRPAFMVNNMFTLKLDTTHEKSKFSETAIHYHMNFFGGDKELLTRLENYHNTTISFWLFDDKVIYQTEGGIGSW